MQRLERMQRNAAKLQQLAVRQKLADMQTPVASAPHIMTCKTKQRRNKAPAQRRQPVRTSARVRGIAADPSQLSSSDAINAAASMQLQEEEAGPSETTLFCQHWCVMLDAMLLSH